MGCLLNLIKLNIIIDVMIRSLGGNGLSYIGAFGIILQQKSRREANNSTWEWINGRIIELVTEL